MAYAALVVYASLYPFDGWRWPTNAAWKDLFIVPWMPWGDEFDLWSNLLGYVPFGLLLAIGRLRSGSRLAVAMGVAVLVPVAFSYGLEVLQTTLPTRHPSLKDLLMNSVGGGIGALLALAMHRLGLVDGWHALRQRWFEREGAGALALLALWPVGLLFPAPAPLGLGQIGGGRLLDAVSAWFEGLPLSEAAREVISPSPATTAAAAAAASVGLSPLAEVLIVALGLLAPCVVAFSVVAPGWRRLAMACGALLLAAIGMTLSTALNFGPRHALAWITPWAGPAVGLAALGVLALAPMPRAVVLGVGLMVLTGLVVGVAQAPADPYFAQSLQAWEQGRFVHFHGLAQWIGWLWPYAAIAWMLSRLAART
ncbi:MAG: VanZ family protein [Burkholderiales bacterium]|nr:VanZ family protein [Burkholderiales bacterium]